MAISFNVQGASSIQQILSNSAKSLNKSNEQLSTGKQDNRASDNSAALAIVADLEAEIATTRQASRNVYDGVSLANIADGGLSQVSDSLIRLRELATQSANSTLSEDQRASLDQEFQAIAQEINRTAETTAFNGQQLLAGGGGSFTIQVGGDSSGNSQISLSTPGVSTTSLNLSGVSIATAAGAASALDAVGEASRTISRARGELGASVARLEVANNQLQTERVNFEDAASRLRDSNIAQAAADSVASRIRLVAGVAVLASANQNAGSVLNLLK
jgi:flagellin